MRERGNENKGLNGGKFGGIRAHLSMGQCSVGLASRTNWSHLKFPFGPRACLPYSVAPPCKNL
jgi:hypothetical protein